MFCKSPIATMSNLLIFTIFALLYIAQGQLSTPTGDITYSSTPHFQTSATTNAQTSQTTSNKTTTTTTPTSTTTTTPKPTTSTAPISTKSTPPSPTTVPTDPTTIKFNMTDNEGKICILFSAAIRMSFKFINEANENETQWTEIPKDDVRSDGKCSKETQELILNFYNNWNLTITFAKNESVSKSEYHMKSLRLEYRQEPKQYPFVNAANMKEWSNTTGEVEIKDDWITDGKSYACTAKKQVYTSTKLYGLKEIDFYNEQYIAFENSTNPVFGTPEKRCTNDSVSNLIPIIVGAALGGLIIIVLIAYLIGRRRSKRGYESV